MKWENENSYNNIGKTKRNNGYYQYIKATALAQPSGDKF